MRLRNVEDCFHLRLLRKIKPDRQKSRKSLDLSKKRLKRAQEALKSDFLDFAILESYMAMFHAARALLYKDGIQEKNHYAIFLYRRERYATKIPLRILNLFNLYRIERYETMYGLEYQPRREDALSGIEDAKMFVREIEKNL